MPHEPLFEKVLLSQSSFLVKEEHFSGFDIAWHVHPEFELTYISQGEGKINVGDYISELDDSKLLLIGPNMPHSWYGPKEPVKNILAKQIVIQFPLDFLGDTFFKNPAFKEIRELLDKSYRGLLFDGPEKHMVAKRIKKVLLMNEFERTMELLNLLQTLATSRNYTELSSMGYSKRLNSSESVRLNTIYAFILDNFKTELYLKTVADIANMTPQAFSRYFKERTKRTFISFLNEVRIGYACRLLSEHSLTVSQICFESGYSNLSNFNRQFKKIKSITPSQYASGIKIN